MHYIETMFSILGENEAMKKLGKRIQEERLRRNLSQAYMSKVLGISIPTYRKIESGDGTVELRHAVRALGVLGYAEKLGEIIPETTPELRLRDLTAPQRKRASHPRKA